MKVSSYQSDWVFGHNNNNNDPFSSEDKDKHDAGFINEISTAVDASSNERAHRYHYHHEAEALTPRRVPLVGVNDDIRNNDDNDVDGFDFEKNGDNEKRIRNKRRSASMKFLVTIMLFVGCVSVITMSAIVPTTEEVELAHSYGVSLPYLTGAIRIRSAQRMADMIRLEMLSSSPSSDSSDASMSATSGVEESASDATNPTLATAAHMVADKKQKDENKDSEKKSHLKKAYKEIDKHDSAAKDYVEPPEGCEATVVIVRHCEKGSVREHCAHIGYERSVYLSTLFGDSDHERWPAPSFIFAEGPGDRENPKKLNFREIETVGPLAEKLGLEVDDSYTELTLNMLTKKLLTFIQTGKMCGQVALISWKHSSIAHMARRLGCGPSEGCPLDYHGSTFDDTWHVKFIYDRPKHSSNKQLRLPKHPEWRVFGSVQGEHFDPLSFSKRAGDYPPGGSAHGGRWEKQKVDVPERKSVRDTSVWSETHIDLDAAASATVNAAIVASP